MVKHIFELCSLDCLSSQMKQSIIQRTQDNIRGLHELKENGHKVGKLRYKSLVQSIPLKQYGNTYKIIDNNHVHIQGIKQHIKVRGLKQNPENSDFANGTLICKHGDYYLSVTTYHEKKINKEYDRINNIKKDIKCKIITHLLRKIMVLFVSRMKM
jgi:putative transposase